MLWHKYSATEAKVCQSHIRVGRYYCTTAAISCLCCITTFTITTFPCQLSCFLLQHTTGDHTLSLSAVALSMHTCQPWASAERWGWGLRTLSRTTQDGCFPSCSSISRPMIHFTDTWVIIGVCSSPLGMKLHERSQGGECVCVWGGLVGRGSKDRVRSEWVKTKRQEWREWRWSRRCSEIHLNRCQWSCSGNAIFSVTQQWSKLITAVTNDRWCNKTNKSNENIQHMTF